MKHLAFFLLAFIFFSCQNNEQKNSPTTETNSSYSNGLGKSDNFLNGNLNDNNQPDSYHTDPSYKYEYRTGSSGDYEYNYDISGSDENGNSVYGNIDIQGKYGTGYIEDEDGNEKSIDVEWVDYGVLEGTDEDGNSFEFEVDE